MIKGSMKKLLILLLVLLMLVPVAAACKKDDTPDTDNDSGDVSESQSVSDSESESSKYEVYDDLGDIDLNGRTVSIAYVSGSDYDSEVAVERLTGDVVADEVFKRNMAVEQRINAKIKGVPSGSADAYSVANTLSEAVLAGQPATFDVMLSPSYVTCGYVTRGLYHDLNKVENLNLSKIYWAQFLNETYDIGGVQYSASGAISLSFYKFVFITLVNDNMLADTKGEVPDLVKVVKEGNWTIEYHTQLIKDYYVDKGVAGRDEEDILGFVGSTGTDYDAYLSSCDITVLSKGDDGFYSYDFDLARASDAMDDIVALFNSPAAFAFGDADMDVRALKKFAQSEALTISSRLVELEDTSMKKMKDEYTVLPVPKLDAGDTPYHSLISDRFTSVAIPVSVSKDALGDIGAAIEALASDSYRRVVPTYLETVLRTRYTNSPDKWEVMNMIMENVKMDACLPYTNSLMLTGEPRNTIVKLWRYTAWKGYTDSSNIISSVFNSSVETKINENLNGAEGLQTYIKEQLAKQ